MAKKLIRFARVEPTRGAISEKIDIFGSEINKRIIFYITDGKKMSVIHKEPYTEAKEKFLRKRMIFMPEKITEKIPFVKQDISAIKLTRVG